MKRFAQAIKKFVSVATVGAALFGMFGGGSAQASFPVFNQLQGDAEFTVGRTQHQTAYSDPVTATTQDRVTIAVYYHNDVQNAIADNTTIKAQLPTAVATQHIIKTTLSADNATSITDTVVNGQIVGSPDLTINLDQAAAVSYVPGSTLWFPDLQQNPTEAGMVMPDSITTSGLNIGQIAGCWSHAGYVLFDVAFSSNPQLQTDKWVSLYGGNNQWVKQNTANAGDTLTYQIYFNNPGNTTATSAVVTDTLPAHVTYVPGTMSKRVKDINNNDVDIAIPDSQLTLSGQTITVPLGNVLPGQGNSGFLTFRAQIASNLAVGSYTLTNNEVLSATNVPSVTASAVTTVNVTPTPVSDVKILKEVANTSQGSTTWVKSDTAKPGDHLQYRLTVYNQGTAPSGTVSVNDVLPSNVSYVAGSTKIYTTNPNNFQTLADGITVGGVTIGTVTNGVPAGNRYIVFDVIISQTMPAGNTDLINTANVFENGVMKDTSTATTTVTTQTGLILTKEVWNAGTNQWVTSLSGVKPGDTVTYRIMVRNTGNTTINSPVIKDTLPALLTFVPGSTIMDGSVAVADAWMTTGNGLLIANVIPGLFKTITFQATVGACPPGGTTTQTNVASVAVSGMTTLTASADIIITAGPPAVPQ